MTDTAIADHHVESRTDIGRRARVVLLVGSTRTRRLADAILPWLRTYLETASWVELDVVDLRRHVIAGREVQPGGRSGSPIAEALARADAFVVLTPEYNHSFPAPLKEAIDHHFDEWAYKPVAFVSYGASSGGIRAVEQLRLVFAEVRATTTRNAVALVAPWNELESGRYTPAPEVDAALRSTLAELRWWTFALRAAREAEGIPA